MKTPTAASHPIGELYEKLQGQHSVQWFFEEVLSEDEAEKLKRQMRAKGLANDFIYFFDNRLPHIAKLYGEFKRMPIELAVVTLAKKRVLITEEKRNFLLRKYELKHSEIEFNLREAKERADLVVDAYRDHVFWRKKEIVFRFGTQPGSYFLKLAEAASEQLTIGPKDFHQSVQFDHLTDWKNKLKGVENFPIDLWKKIQVQDKRHRLRVDKKKIYISPKDGGSTV
jgi:hypothetical protein